MAVVLAPIAGRSARVRGAGVRPAARAPLRALALLLVALALLLYQGRGAALAQAEGSGLPLPRFASLAAERINVRTGPGKQYPIRWIYARSGLPVRIVAEYDTWRKIEDRDGDQGWVHVSLLSGRRTVVVQGGLMSLHRQPELSAPIVLKAETGVIGRLARCQVGWCEIEVAGRDGWMQQAGLWGLDTSESGS